MAPHGPATVLTTKGIQRCLFFIFYSAHYQPCFNFQVFMLLTIAPLVLARGLGNAHAFGRQNSPGRSSGHNKLPIDEVLATANNMQHGKANPNGSK